MGKMDRLQEESKKIMNFQKTTITAETEKAKKNVLKAESQNSEKCSKCFF